MSMSAPLDAWLAQISERVPGVRGALVVAGKSKDGPFPLLATRPGQEAPSEELLVSAQMAAGAGRPVMRGDAEGRGWQAIAAPLALPGAPHCAVAVALSLRPHPELLEALQALQAAAAALPTRLQPSASGQSGSAAARGLKPKPPADSRSDSLARDTLDLVATCLDHREFRAAATAVANELATRHQCERVSLGFVEGYELRVVALSHSARFDERSQLIRDLAAAMAEAVDQEAVVLDPPLPGGPELARRAHAALREHGTAAACTLPIASHGEIIGAVTFEAPPTGRIDPGLADRVRPVVDLVGPILLAKFDQERPLGARLLDAVRDQIDAIRDPEHPGRKLALSAVAGVTAFLALVPAPYRVSAPARLEGVVQRAVVAPTDGFITESRARAGDTVKQGQVLGSLDASELALERRKWLARREQYTRQLRAAMAEHDASKVAVLRAQVEQAAAEVALQEELLKRTELVAPFDGVVARGDWAQSLGSPVARGDVMFEISPLDQYRIILEVDQRDLGDVQAGAKGELTLSSLPSERFDLVVEHITPVATAADSRNFFRVEARLDGVAQSLRPGMQGVGKIHAGWRQILWIWSHSLLDWLRLWLWARLP